MKRIDQLRNLLVMAASDGSLSENEIKYLVNHCKKWGLPEAALAEAIEYALSDDAELTLPPRESERVQMLSEMMSMMAADGQLADTEMTLFAVAAAQMGVSEVRVNQMIDRLTKAKQNES